VPTSPHPLSPAAWDALLLKTLQESDPLHPQALQYHLEEALPHLPWLLAQDERRIWFAGVGLSLAPILFASYGCHAFATDIAPTALRFLAQHQRLRWQEKLTTLPKLLKRYNLPPPSLPPILLTLQEGDFCLAPPAYNLDLILNLRAFLCLSPSDQDRALTVFSDALRAGGWLLLTLPRLDESARQMLAEKLRANGFTLPFADADAWLRQEASHHNLPLLHAHTRLFSASFDLDTPIPATHTNNPAESSTPLATEKQKLLHEGYLARLRAAEALRWQRQHDEQTRYAQWFELPLPP
jgi:SAM-dependent methyltransferase